MEEIAGSLLSSSPVEEEDRQKKVQKEEKDDDEEVFEIVDFTQASPWERFIANIEDILRKWNLDGESYGDSNKPTPPLESTDPNCVSVKETVNFAGRSYGLNFHFYRSSDSSVESLPQHFPQTMIDMMNPTLDYPSPAHHIQRWFGIREFLVLFPLAEKGADESEAHLLFSTLSIVLDNCRSPIPGFVPVLDRSKGLYIGYMLANTSKTMVSLSFRSELRSHIPPQYSTVPGIVKKFRDLLHSQKGDENRQDEDSILIGSRFTYMRGGTDPLWHSEIEKAAQSEDPINEEESTKFTTCCWERDLLWGTALSSSSPDPVEALHIALTWKPVEQEVLVAHHSSPPTAFLDSAEWSVRCIFRGMPLGVLAHSLRHLGGETLRASRSVSSMSQLIRPDRRRASSDVDEDDEPGDGGEEREEELDAETDRRERFVETIARSLAGALQVDLPTVEELQSIIRSLFNPTHHIRRRVEENKVSERNEIWVAKKGASPGTLLSALAASVLNLERLEAIGLLWAEFVRELRWYWERNMYIPRVDLEEECDSDDEEEEEEKEEEGGGKAKKAAGKTIDYRACLIQQKLQMLNYCIRRARRKKREDAAEKEGEMEKDGEGRKEVYKKEDGSTTVPLLKGDGRLIWVPHTQESGWMTEDMVTAREIEFAELGTSEEAARKRAKMQSGALKADIMAFKAANPGCILEDFVRWYSPSDWIETAEGGSPESGSGDEDDTDVETWNLGNGRVGRLSPRMRKGEGRNLWRQMWEDSPALAARKQEQLFDFQNEGERVLRDLQTIPARMLIGELVVVTMSCVYGSFSCLPITRIRGGVVREAMERMKDAFLAVLVDDLDKDEEEEEFEDEGTTAAPHKQLYRGQHGWEAVCDTVRDCEWLITKAMSLLHKFPGQYEMVDRLLRTGHLEIAKDQANSELKAAIMKWFVIEEEEGILIPDPDAREFILRTITQRPYASSPKYGNRMYVLLTHSDCRIATALAAAE